MTTAHLAQPRTGAASDQGVRPTNPLGFLWRLWSARRAYRAALTELRALSIRQREDVGIVGLDLAQVARAATYGN